MTKGNFFFFSSKSKLYSKKKKRMLQEEIAKVTPLSSSCTTHCYSLRRAMTLRLSGGSSFSSSRSTLSRKAIRAILQGKYWCILQWLNDSIDTIVKDLMKMKKKKLGSCKFLTKPKKKKKKKKKGKLQPNHKVGLLYWTIRLYALYGSHTTPLIKLDLPHASQSC